MKRKTKTILALLLALAMMMCMAACSGSDDTETAGGADAQTEEETAAEEQADMPEILKTLTPDSEEEIGKNIPMQIDSITLYEDGSVAIVPTDDLKKNEIKDDAEAVYPFEESGAVDDVCVVVYGNGGYRTILALMHDGSISAVNGRALIEDHIFAVMDNVANRDNFVGIENIVDEDEGAASIVGITEDGDEVILDYSLNFDEPQ